MPRPAPSEWGKLNAGQAYGILCVDIGRAIFGIPWGKYELPIVYYVLEHSWGIARTKKRGETWPNPSPCAVNFNQLANDWGMPRQRLYEARDRLKAIGFLLQDGEGFWVNKNAHEWVNPETGEPLLSPKMLAYAFKGRTRLDRSDKETSVTPDRDTMSRPSVTETDASKDVCHVPPCQDVTPERDNMSRSSVTSPIEDRAQDSEILRLTLLHNTTPAGGDILKATPDGPSDPEMLPAYPVPNDLLDIGPGSHDLTETEAREIWRRLWLVSGRSDVCKRFYCKQRQHAAATWLRAIQEAATRGTVVRALKIIELYAGDVETGAIRDDAPRPSPVPARGSQAGPKGKPTMEENYAAGMAMLERIKAKEANGGR